MMKNLLKTYARSMSYKTIQTADFLKILQIYPMIFIA